MAYEKNTWQSGDVVTSSKLNNIEGGVANATPFWVSFTATGPDTYTCDASMDDIYAAYQAGRAIFGKDENNTVYIYSNDYNTGAMTFTNIAFFSSNSDVKMKFQMFLIVYGQGIYYMWKETTLA